MSCSHTHITPGLDACQCKNCGKWWQSWQPEYDRLLNQDAPNNQDAPESACEHHWIVTWSSDCQLVNYCDRCYCTQPVSDPSVLERERSLVRKIKADYEQQCEKARKPSRKREFEAAMQRLKQQLDWLNQQLVQSRQDFKVGDRIFHIKWKRYGIIRAPISPNWVVRLSNGDFVVAGCELQLDPDPPVLPVNPEFETGSTDTDDPNPPVLPVEPEFETGSTNADDPNPPVLPVNPEFETGSTDTDDPNPPVLPVEPEFETGSTNADDPNPPVLPVNPEFETRRKRGGGTGRIHWRKLTKKNGKEYKQAWYDWQTHEGGKTVSRSAYIPKRLMDKIKELEDKKALVREILKLLGRD